MTIKNMNKEAFDDLCKKMDQFHRRVWRDKMDIVILEELNKQIEGFERDLWKEKNEFVKIHLRYLLDVLRGNRDRVEEVMR